MSTSITVKCPTCGYKWSVDLDDYQVERTVYKGKEKKARVEEYRFKCPKDGTYFIWPVTREE